VGRLLEIFRQENGEYETNELNESSSPDRHAAPKVHKPEGGLFRQIRLFRALQQLERRCPGYIDPADWERAVEDARKFLSKWGVQAEALGWTSDDLFELAPVPDDIPGGYRRLSRYELTGLIWLLRGRPVVAVTATTVAIQHMNASITVYRKKGSDRSRS
jgi:hypothetical protein